MKKYKGWVSKEAYLVYLSKGKRVLTRGEVQELLNSLKDLNLGEKPMTGEMFAERVYSIPKGRMVIDALNNGSATADKLRKWGFMAAYMTLSSKLK